MNLCLDASGGSVKSQFSYVSGHRVNQYGYCSTLYGSEGIMNLRMMRQLDNGFIRIYRDLQVVIKRRTRRLFLFGVVNYLTSRGSHTGVVTSSWQARVGAD
jgi:hypothetical protein